MNATQNIMTVEVAPAAQTRDLCPAVLVDLRPRNVRQFVGETAGAVLARGVGMVLERQSSMAVWLTREIEELKRAASFQKPLLSMDEAAAMVGVSRKRIENLVFEERQRLGRLPDFVCDAGGRMKRRILRDELVEWMKKRRPARGRPPKRSVR